MIKSLIWALDYGARRVSVLAAHEKKQGTWSVVAAAQAPAQGVRSAEILKLTDAVESVVAAVRAAETQAGARCRQLFYNFDDPEAISIHPAGSITLSGEGQIQRADVEEAVRNATRQLSDYERIPVYLREIHYVIDGHDTVANPFGVYGRRLEVTLHAVLARALHFGQWSKVMERAGYSKAVPVLSLASSAAAVVDSKRPSVVVWDLGEDVVSGGIVERGNLREYAVFRSDGMNLSEIVAMAEAQSNSWKARHGISAPSIWTGEWASREDALFGDHTKSVLGTPPEVRLGSNRFGSPEYAALIGLLTGAQRLGQKARLLKSDSNWIGRAKGQALSVIKEYF